MAGIVERFKKKTRSDSPRDWNTSGSFMNKPQRGWLHPDEQLNPEAGVVYGVRVSYIPFFSMGICYRKCRSSRQKLHGHMPIAVATIEADEAMASSDFLKFMGFSPLKRSQPG